MERVGVGEGEAGAVGKTKLPGRVSTGRMSSSAYTGASGLKQNPYVFAYIRDTHP